MNWYLFKDADRTSADLQILKYLRYILLSLQCILLRDFSHKNLLQQVESLK